MFSLAEIASLVENHVEKNVLVLLNIFLKHDQIKVAFWRGILNSSHNTWKKMSDID